MTEVRAVERVVAVEVELTVEEAGNLWLILRDSVVWSRDPQGEFAQALYRKLDKALNG